MHKINIDTLTKAQHTSASAAAAMPSSSDAPVPDANAKAVVSPSASGRGRIGKYQVGRILGSGSFGQVHEAFHTETQDRVAIKVLALEKIKNLKLTDQVRREISNLRRLSHRNIMQLIEVLKNKQHLFLVCEMVQGGDLFDQLGLAREQGLPEDQARAIFKQIVQGVAYCHSQGVSHRDLKPENVLLTRDGVVKLTDFGFCNTFISGAEERELTTACGTPNYIAPEMTLFHSYSGRAVDAWSCGVMLYQFVSGRLPFDNDDTAALFQSIRTARFHMPQSFSPSLQDLIARILVADPALRLTLDQIKAHPWMMTPSTAVQPV